MIILIDISDAEVLRYAIENGIVDVTLVQKQIEMTKRQEYLAQHPYKIWVDNDEKWNTYINDEEKGRVRKKKKSQKEIEDAIIDYYESLRMQPCFREVYKEWIAEKTEFEEIGKNSITRYNNDFERFFPKNSDFCKIKLCNMTNSVLERFIKTTIKQNNLSAKSYSMLRLIIKGVFTFAKREGYTNYSISTFFGDLSLPSNIFMKKIKNKDLEIFNDDESKRVVNYLLNNPTIVNLGLVLQFYTGLRVGELSSIKVEDNIKNNVLYIHRTEYMYNDNDGKRVTVVKDYPKTESGVRNVLLPNKAQTLIKRIILMNPTRDFLFEENGKRITSKRFNYSLNKACKEVNIAPRSTHKVRKTYASKLLSSGVDDAIVMNQLGHSDINTTHEYYHYDITNDIEKLQQIDNVVSY